MRDDVETGAGAPTVTPDGTDSVYRTSYDPERERITTSLVCALATVEGVPPTELDVRIEDALDTDALERIFGDERHGVERLEFGIDGYAVTVRGSGTIAVRRRERRP